MESGSKRKFLKYFNHKRSKRLYARFVLSKWILQRFEAAFTTGLSIYVFNLRAVNSRAIFRQQGGRHRNLFAIFSETVVSRAKRCILTKGAIGIRDSLKKKQLSTKSCNSCVISKTSSLVTRYMCGNFRQQHSICFVSRNIRVLLLFIFKLFSPS